MENQDWCYCVRIGVTVDCQDVLECQRSVWEVRESIPVHNLLKEASYYYASLQFVCVCVCVCVMLLLTCF